MFFTWENLGIVIYMYMYVLFYLLCQWPWFMAGLFMHVHVFENAVLEKI